MRSQANVDVQLALLDAANGGTVYADEDFERRTAFDLLGSGIFASIDDLRRMAQQVLNQAVDRLLDRPGFQAAVRSRMADPALGGATVVTF